MTIQTATPYLILNGQAQRAIALYQRALGANPGALQRFGDVDGSCPEARKSFVMHAELRVGDAMLMLSDGPAEGPMPGAGAVSIALNIDDQAQARQSFEALAASGKVIQPLFDAPWGALFGVVADEFGVHWMFNCSTKPPAGLERRA
ncbi:MAG TPA: VOC family protein [Polyangiaceae bacterium]|nr:VOC family protein [Polyangiaceae bacterium]